MREEEREKNKARQDRKTVGREEKWTEREVGGRGEMQIQIEPKREMKRCRSREGDRDGNMKYWSVTDALCFSSTGFSRIMPIKHI